MSADVAVTTIHTIGTMPTDRIKALVAIITMCVAATVVACAAVLDDMILLGSIAKNALAVWLALQNTADRLPPWDRIPGILGSRKICSGNAGVRKRGAGQVTIDEFCSVQHGPQKRGIFQRASRKIMVGQECVVQNCAVQSLTSQLGDGSREDCST